MIRLLVFILLFVEVLVFPLAVYAGGGGRAVITVTKPGVAGGKGADIVATVYKDNEYKISSDEFGLFRIANAAPGQNCTTHNQRSDAEGKIYGTCTSPIEGTISVYVHFPDKVEDAQSYRVPFSLPGKATSAPTVTTASYGPCGSGLTSYGWRPQNGKNCPKDHYDKWTTSCGNGYTQDTSVGNCIHANELLNHPEWRAVAIDICRNPRCNTPAAHVLPPVASPNPKPVATLEPTASTSATRSVDQVPMQAPNEETKSISQERKGILSVLFSILLRILSR